MKIIFVFIVIYSTVHLLQVFTLMWRV